MEDHVGHRDDLLAVMAAARNDVDTLVAGYTEADWLEDLGDGWRRKDVYAHIALWDRMAETNITGAPNAEDDEIIAGREWDIHVFNQTARARDWDLPVSDILTALQDAYAAVVAVVSAADDEEAAPGNKVFRVILIDTVGHYAVHLPIPDRMHDRWPEHCKAAADR